MQKYTITDSQTQVCDICMRIACKQCNWVASDEEVAKIQLGKMTSCPVCGWKPQ